MKDIKEIAAISGIEFDDNGLSKMPVSLNELQTFFDIVVNQTNIQWSQATFSQMSQPFTELQDKFKEAFKGFNNQ
jgi:hypothetical protein